MIHCAGGLGGAVQLSVTLCPPSFLVSAAWRGNACAVDERTPRERTTNQAADFTQGRSSGCTTGWTSTRTVGPDRRLVKPRARSGLDHLHVRAREQGAALAPEIHL